MSRAIVIGGGIAGWLAVRAVSNHFEQVTLLEHENGAATALPRKGVPQGGHVHLLLKAGEEYIESLLPGFVDELESAGAMNLDMARDVAWMHHGVWKLREPVGLSCYFQSRPLLESVIRTMVMRGCPRVLVREGASVRGLSLQGDRVTGVECKIDGMPTRLPGDLIVDTSGRRSRLPNWLESAGSTPICQQKVPLNLKYVTRSFRARPAEWKALAVYPHPPHQKRAGLIFPVEGSRWNVTLLGYAGDHPPLSDEGWLGFAASLDSPTLADTLAGAVPLSSSRAFHVRDARWRRFDWAKLPRGLVAIGDSVCSFDPVFGQGMTMAAAGAALLSSRLRADGLDVDSHAFHRTLARQLRLPWMLAELEDARFPELARPLSISQRLLQSYLGAVLRLTGSHPATHRRFLRCLNMVSGPLALAHPTTLVRALTRARS